MGSSGRLFLALAACLAVVAAIVFIARVEAPQPKAPVTPVASKISEKDMTGEIGEVLVVEGLSEPEIVITLDQITAIEAPMEKTADSGAVGGYCLTVPEGLNNAERHPEFKIDSEGRKHPNGSAVFTFSVPESGEYVLWAHKRWGHSCADSFKVAFDDGKFEDFRTDSNYGIWEWATRRTQRCRLEKGTHTLRVANREDGFRVDRFLLTTGSHKPAPVK